MMKIAFLSTGIFLLLLTIGVNSVVARELYWDEHHIDLSGLTEEQVLGLEATLNQLTALEPVELRIDKKLYRRLSRFRDLFGFPFSGKDLSQWLLTRIHSISYENEWTVAVNQNQGSFMVGDFFFTKTTPIERLYTMIHEARHSDGDGYKHVRCPDGFKYISSRQPEMDLEREPACDPNDRGAYAFQAAFLFELFAYGLLDQGEAGLLYNSSISRLVPYK